MPAHILVVEDSATQAQVVQRVLESAGYEVELARSGEEGLALFDAERCDAVISDVVMPGAIDGYELCRRIKSTETGRAVPVMLLTSLSSPMDIINGLASGADNFLTKPYDAAHLVERVQVLLRTREARAGRKLRVGVDVYFMGQAFNITSDREQILDLLISTFEDAVLQNQALRAREDELRLARAELAKYTESLEMRLESVLESVPDVLFSMSADLSDMSYVSPAATRVFGFTPQEFMADSGLWQRLVEPNDGALVQTALDRARDGTTANAQFRMKHRDDSVRWLDVTVVPVRNTRGEVERLDGILRDVTEARELENQLRAVARDMTEKKEAELNLGRALDDSRRANAELDQASRFKDEFLANMSHELRTPLNAILGLSETLLEQLADSVTPRQILSLTTIATSGQHLLALINDILDLSKIEAGMLELNLDTVNVSEFCESCLAFVHTQAIQKHIDVAVEHHGHVGTLVADPKRLKQILVNLLTNAVKFTPAGGRIGLTVAAPEGEEVMRFTVWDTGIGIAPADATTLFRAFTQLDSGLSRDQEGTGLGLALVAKLAELHGGSVALESAPAEGSRFIVTLPLIAAAPVPAVAPVPQDDTDHRGGRVLIIEDDPTSGDTFVKYLAELGLDSVVHVRGEEAVEAVLRERPDVILLDILLPGESGWLVLVKLKEHPGTRDIPVVVVSAVDQPEKSRALGAVAHFTKPVTRAQLAEFFQRPAVQRPHRAARRAPAPSAGGPLVLLAEDNEANVQTIGGYLEDKGYAMYYASNGLEAVQHARALRPALILMDIQMPVMDGLAAIRAIRANAEMQDIPIVALTALAMAGDRERCLAAGATEYLSKPVNLKGLAALVSQLVPQTGVR